MPVTDRAAVVAEALVSEIGDVLTTTTVPAPSFAAALWKSCATSLRRSAQGRRRSHATRSVVSKLK
jgi:hypothetical protein